MLFWRKTDKTIWIPSLPLSTNPPISKQFFLDPTLYLNFKNKTPPNFRGEETVCPVTLESFCFLHLFTTKTVQILKRHGEQCPGCFGSLVFLGTTLFLKMWLPIVGKGGHSYPFLDQPFLFSDSPLSRNPRYPHLS